MTTKYTAIQHKHQVNPPVVGRRYRNRLGWYEVLGLAKNGKVLVKYENETIPNQELDWNLAYKIHSNMAKEDVQALPKSRENATPYDKKNFGKTLGLLCQVATFHATVHPRGMDGFAHDYKEATGSLKNPFENEHYISDKVGPETWGNTLGFYFNKKYAELEWFCLPAHINLADSNGESNEITVTNSEFFWHLVRRLGFKLGREQDKELIKSKLPEDIRNDFEAGLNVILA